MENSANDSDIPSFAPTPVVLFAPSPPAAADDAVPTPASNASFPEQLRMTPDKLQSLLPPGFRADQLGNMSMSDIVNMGQHTMATVARAAGKPSGDTPAAVESMLAMTQTAGGIFVMWLMQAHKHLAALSAHCSFGSQSEVDGCVVWEHGGVKRAVDELLRFMESVMKTNDSTMAHNAFKGCMYLCLSVLTPPPVTPDTRMPLMVYEALQLKVDVRMVACSALADLTRGTVGVGLEEFYAWYDHLNAQNQTSLITTLMNMSSIIIGMCVMAQREWMLNTVPGAAPPNFDDIVNKGAGIMKMVADVSSGMKRKT